MRSIDLSNTQALLFVLFRSALFHDYVKVVPGCLPSPLRPSVKKRHIGKALLHLVSFLYTYAPYEDIIQESNAKKGYGKYVARARHITPGCVH